MAVLLAVVFYIIYVAYHPPCHPISNETGTDTLQPADRRFLLWKYFAIIVLPRHFDDKLRRAKREGGWRNGTNPVLPRERDRRNRRRYEYVLFKSHRTPVDNVLLFSVGALPHRQRLDCLPVVYSFLLFHLLFVHFVSLRVFRYFRGIVLFGALPFKNPVCFAPELVLRLITFPVIVFP